MFLWLLQDSEWMFPKSVLRLGELGIRGIVTSIWVIPKPSSIFLSFGKWDISFYTTEICTKEMNAVTNLLTKSPTFSAHPNPNPLCTSWLPIEEVTSAEMITFLLMGQWMDKTSLRLKHWSNSALHGRMCCHFHLQNQMQKKIISVIRDRNSSNAERKVCLCE